MVGYCAATAGMAAVMAWYDPGVTFCASTASSTCCTQSAAPASSAMRTALGSGRVKDVPDGSWGGREGGQGQSGA